MEPTVGTGHPTGLFLLLGLVLLLIHLLFALGAGFVAKSKDRGFGGWLLLGIFFGFFAFLLALCFPKSGQPFGAGNVIAVVLLVGLPALVIPCGGIMAAIAIPNFLEAQIRAKVARARSDTRTMGLALETYYIDNSVYPPEKTFPASLTSPIAYTSAAPTDPFTQPPKNYGYRLEVVNDEERWVLWSWGPDGADNGAAIEYDPTNGTTSRGDIVRYSDTTGRTGRGAGGAPSM